MRREVFKSLFDEQFDPLRNYLFYRCGDENMATDVAQDAFLKLWEKQWEKPPEELVKLLYKIAKDNLITKFRRHKKELEYTTKPPVNNHSLSPEEELDYKELQVKYENALKEMPEIQREVFFMSRNDELKYHEIAEKLDLSIKAVEKRMKNALQYLRQKLTVQ
nr:sigma-70 family RNA polymerase sigma factor [uncultured Carboxylicivirga sp.]